MATIPRSVLNSYQDYLEKGSDKVKAQLGIALSNYYDTHYQEIMTGDRTKVLNDIKYIMNQYCAVGTQFSSKMAADFYTAVRKIQLGDDGYNYNSLSIDTRDPAATDGFVDAQFGKLEGWPSKEKFLDDCMSRAGYEVKRAAGECVYANGRRDPERVRFARVPAPGSKCKFCLMLASRGFEYRSAKSAGDKGGSHYHDNCRCSIVPEFTTIRGKLVKNTAGIEGYDPDALYKEWREGGGAEEMAAKRQRDRENGVTRSRNESMYKTEATENTPAFKNFNDIKAYIYKAKDDADLEARYTNLAHIYGYDSKQLQSQSLKNVIKTTRKNF